MPVENTREDLYPIPILFVKLTGFEFDKVQREIGNVVKGMVWKEHPSFINTQKLSSDSFGSDIINEKNLEVLKVVIDNAVNDYCRVLGFNSAGPYYMESWLTRNSKGDYSTVHNHGVADISGVYYYDTTGNDGDFFFQSPTSAATTTFCLQLIHGNRHYKPETGRMMLFPSFMGHGVTRNVEDRERISLAFNIRFNRGRK
jgi:uncharacterized protein (TIGR02466 family)